MKFNCKIIALSTLALVVIIGAAVYYRNYSHVDNNKTSHVETNLDVNKSQILSYDDYERLFKDIVNNIDIPGLEVKANTLGNKVTIIDKELSFDKRQYLTLSGNLDKSNIAPTDGQLTLEDNKQSKQVTIGIYYTNSYIGNDFIGWPSNAGFENLNKTLVDKSSYSILSYKNLIIQIHQSAVDKADLDLMEKTMKSLIALLKKY